MATSTSALLPAKAAPESTSADARDQRVKTFLLRLGRAVQRASIYPPGHPAVSQGMAPIVELMHQLVEDGPVSIAVGQTRLVVGGGGYPPAEHEASWLASRLFEREIAAVELTTGTDASDTARLVAWLSATGPAADNLPEFSGVRLTRFDGAHLRFRERGAARPSTPEATVAWHALTAPLRASYGIDDADPGADDPGALGDRIRQVIHYSEGTGITALSDELVRVHTGLAPLDADARAETTEKLARLVGNLSPELRGTLLATGPSENTGKLALVEDLLPFLSSSVIADIAANLTLPPGAPQGPFARFLKKLSRAASDDPSAGEILDARVRLAGLPASLLRGHDDIEHSTALDGQHPVSEGSRHVVPTKYGARLEQLADQVVEHAGPAADETDAAFDESDLDEHLARIALLQVRRNLTDPDAGTYFRALAGVLPRALARGDVTVTAEVADLVLRLRALGGAATPETHLATLAFERCFSTPGSIALAIDAIVALPTDAGQLASMLLLAGGGGSARAAAEWIRTTTQGDEDRFRVAAALTAFDPDVFKACVGPALADHRRVADACIAVLDRIDPARGIDVATMLATHGSVDVRRKAIAWLLGVSLSPARWQRVLQRALEDADTAILTLALDAAARQPGSLAFETLLNFVRRRVTPALLALQARAVRILADSGSTAVMGLANVLRQRRGLLSADNRRLSLTLASVLDRSSSEQARVVARAWRWSPAGLLSLFTRPADASL